MLISHALVMPILFIAASVGLSYLAALVGREGAVHNDTTLGVLSFFILFVAFLALTYGFAWKPA